MSQKSTANTIITVSPIIKKCNNDFWVSGWSLTLSQVVGYTGDLSESIKLHKWLKSLQFPTRHSNLEHLGLENFKQVLPVKRLSSRKLSLMSLSSYGFVHCISKSKSPESRAYVATFTTLLVWDSLVLINSFIYWGLSSFTNV
jgi:hypothetical protein